ncbi:uncharacterized protein LOC127725834 [Mytilus californianus]|uniref:uncharacterized protein LOC127725834 n=1 Tax=Mytilus californianus TaxID=6549 RepID=UPI0022482763|nr:uncharacterized protein LOC127725834 [Mytilus californianus]XP_052089112.1 uncharacterized protein LOC127725834 [Mytilus californianus]XP_052089113.1 uncharacterized protein LOC127725834 [Mytilus californianus]
MNNIHRCTAKRIKWFIVFTVLCSLVISILNIFFICVHHWCAEHQLSNLTYTKYADKHWARLYVQSVTPNLKTAVEYAVVTKSKDISQDIISKLPNKYIFKPNHMSGGLAIIEGNKVTKCTSAYYRNCPSCKGIDLLQCLQKICDLWLQIVFNPGKEKYYQYIPPKCMFEEYLGSSGFPMDYRVFTFHGKPYFIQVDETKDGRHTHDFFTPKWKRIQMREVPEIYPVNSLAKQPPFFQEMLRYAEILSQPFIMMRMDFFAFDDQYVFAEFTPSHHGCKGRFIPSVIENYYNLVIDNPSAYSDPEVVLQLK